MKKKEREGFWELWVLPPNEPSLKLGKPTLACKIKQILVGPDRGGGTRAKLSEVEPGLGLRLISWGSPLHSGLSSSSS